jgi:hypothetical protein
VHDLVLHGRRALLCNGRLTHSLQVEFATEAFLIEAHGVAAVASKIYIRIEW